MRFLIQVNSGPSNPASRSALAFARASLGAGHSLVRVFFYHDGVLTGSATRISPPGERDLGAEWAELADQSDLDLVLCVGAAQRRGVIDEDLAQEQDRPVTLREGFRIAGLGQWAEALLDSDRVVRFGVGD